MAQANDRNQPWTGYFQMRKIHKYSETTENGTATHKASDDWINSATDDNEQRRLVPSRCLGESRPPPGPGLSFVASRPLSPHDRNIYVTMVHDYYAENYTSLREKKEVLNSLDQVQVLKKAEMLPRIKSRLNCFNTFFSTFLYLKALIRPISMSEKTLRLVTFIHGVLVLSLPLQWNFRSYCIFFLKHSLNMLPSHFLILFCEFVQAFPI